MAWKWFVAQAFTCHCGCQQNYMDDSFVDLLDELRDRVGFPLVVTSGYRCPAHNERVSSTGRMGPHTKGRAADLGVDRDRAVIVLETALQMDFRGFGVHQRGDGRFIHLDATDRPTKTVWSY